MLKWLKRRMEQVEQRKEAEEAAKQQRLEDLRLVLEGIRDGECPIKIAADTPIILKKGEQVRLCLPSVDFMEARAVRHYSGGGVRIAKGVTIGGGTSQSTDELKKIDVGALVLTDRRLVFSGSKRTVNVQLGKIISVSAYTNGVAINRERKQKTEYYLGTNRYSATLKVNERSYDEPLSGTYVRAYIETAIEAANAE